MLRKGTVKWFDRVKGYGFITPEDGQKDFYVHKTNVDTEDQNLEQGQTVEFVTIEGRKGPEAAEVKPSQDS